MCPAGRGALLYLKQQERELTCRAFLVSNFGTGQAPPTEGGEVWGGKNAFSSELFGLEVSVQMQLREGSGRERDVGLKSRKRMLSFRKVAGCSA